MEVVEELDEKWAGIIEEWAGIVEGIEVVAAEVDVATVNKF